MSFSSSGIDQRVSDLVTRPNSPVDNDTWSLSGRTLRDISEVTGRACIIVFIGQSTNNNGVPGTATPANPSKLFNLSLSHPMPNKIYQAKEPLLTSDIVQGHHGMYYGDQLISGGYRDSVVLLPIACGASYAADYSPVGGVVGGPQPGTRSGCLSYRIGLAARLISYAGLDHLPVIIDWQQGEWDSDATPTTYANYKLALENGIAEFKRVGLLKTGNVMLMHRCTRPTNSAGNRNPIRQAQADVVDGVLVRAGADIDTLDGSFRHDGTHFSASGAVSQAALKVPLAAAFLAG